MVTNQELDNILTQVNAILKQYDERIKALESAKQKPTTTKSIASQAKSA
jgi:hypothetical protein